jgi:hypothetical protein
VITVPEEAVCKRASVTVWVKVVVTAGVTMGEATVALSKQPVHTGLALHAYV